MTDTDDLVADTDDLVADTDDLVADTDDRLSIVPSPRSANGPALGSWRSTI